MRNKLKYATIFCALVLVFSASGCFKQKSVNVSGKVTLDGKPLPSCTIHFEPVMSHAKDSKESLRRSAKGLTNEQGEYRLASVLDANAGSPTGECRVRIVWHDPNPPQLDSASDVIKEPPFMLPPACEDGSMTFTVPETGTTEANFDLKSK